MDIERETRVSKVLYYRNLYILNRGLSSSSPLSTQANKEIRDRIVEELFASEEAELCLEGPVQIVEEQESAIYLTNEQADALAIIFKSHFLLILGRDNKCGAMVEVIDSGKRIIKAQIKAHLGFLIDLQPPLSPNHFIISSGLVEKLLLPNQSREDLRIRISGLTTS